MSPVAIQVRITRLAGEIGAEVGGVDAAETLPDDVVAQVRQALLDHKVIFLRDQRLDYAAQVAFARRFGELTLGQMFHARPAAGYADLRTPVRGLYQAGSSTHGGGGVTGIPGRNVVRQILSDRRAARWHRGRLATRV